MKTLYIPKYKIGFLSINKSGSLQMINTLKLFLEYKGIEYTSPNDLSVIENTKIFILVRNPIDRLITSYNWFMINSTYKSIKNKYDINNIHDFLKHYKEILSDLKYDTHIAPQLCTILNSTYHLKNNNLLSKKEIEKKYPNYEFVHVEDIANYHTNFMGNYRMSQQSTDPVRVAPDIKYTLDLFGFTDISTPDKALFDMFYSFVKNSLDNAHHKQSRLEFQNIIDLVIIIINYNIMNNELNLYGYTNHKINLI